MKNLINLMLVMSLSCLCLQGMEAYGQGPLDMAFDDDLSDNAVENSAPNDNFSDLYSDDYGNLGLDAGGASDDYDFGASKSNYDDFTFEDSDTSFGEGLGVGGESVDPCAGGMNLFGDCDRGVSGDTPTAGPSADVGPPSTSAAGSENQVKSGIATSPQSATTGPPATAASSPTAAPSPTTNAVLMPGGVLSETPPPAETTPSTASSTISGTTQDTTQSAAAAYDPILSGGNVIQQPANEANEAVTAESFMLTDDFLDPLDTSPQPANTSQPMPGFPAAVPEYPVTDVSQVSDPGAPPTASEAIEPTANDFAGAPAVPGTMRQVAEGEAPFEYMVEDGDTLYDVCDQLLDEAGYWPKLWSLNPEIKNPHFIYPDMQLRFYPGDSETPPYLQVVAEEDVIPIDKGLLEETLLIKQPIELVVEEVQIHDPRIEVIGPGDLEGASLDQFMSGGSTYNADTLKLQIPGFIFPQEREALAYISSGFDGRVNAGDSHSVLVEASNGIEPGLYSVLRYAGEVSSQMDSEFEGVFYQFAANINIEGQKAEGFFEGRVRNSRLGVRKGDILVPYISTLREIPLDVTPAGAASVNASVVAFDEARQRIGGSGNFVFLDKGSRDGISSGSYLPLFSPVDWRLKDEMSRPNGVIRILEADEISAVGYIVQNQFEIRIGDRTTSF